MYVEIFVGNLPDYVKICLWGASTQAHDRLVLSTLRLSGPLWASLGLWQPACQPPSQPASQAQDRLPGRNSVSSQPASSLFVILFLGKYV